MANSGNRADIHLLKEYKGPEKKKGERKMGKYTGRVGWNLENSVFVLVFSVW